MNLIKLANALFKLSRECPKEYEAILMEACSVLQKMEKKNEQHETI